jgi:hypothetical protein
MIQLKNGERSCKNVETMDACTSSCTAQLRMDAMSKLPTAMSSCTCSDAIACN